MTSPKPTKKKNELLVASIAPFNGQGKLLFGLRISSNKYNLPGGRLEEGEDPLDAAKRELTEETGLTGENFESLGHGIVTKGSKTIRVFCFKCKVQGSPTGANDPDKECTEFKWVEPSKVGQLDLHNPVDVTLRLLNLQPGDVKKHEIPLKKVEWPPHIAQALAGLSTHTPTPDTDSSAWHTDPVLQQAAWLGYLDRLGGGGGTLSPESMAAGRRKHDENQKAAQALFDGVDLSQRPPGWENYTPEEWKDSDEETKKNRWLNYFGQKAWDDKHLSETRNVGLMSTNERFVAGKRIHEREEDEKASAAETENGFDYSKVPPIVDEQGNPITNRNHWRAAGAKDRLAHKRTWGQYFRKLADEAHIGDSPEIILAPPASYGSSGYDWNRLPKDEQKLHWGKHIANQQLREIERAPDDSPFTPEEWQGLSPQERLASWEITHATTAKNAVGDVSRPPAGGPWTQEAWNKLRTTAAARKAHGRFLHYGSEDEFPWRQPPTTADQELKDLYPSYTLPQKQKIWEDHRAKVGYSLDRAPSEGHSGWDRLSPVMRQLIWSGHETNLQNRNYDRSTPPDTATPTTINAWKHMTNAQRDHQWDLYRAVMFPHLTKLNPSPAGNYQPGDFKTGELRYMRLFKHPEEADAVERFFGPQGGNQADQLMALKLPEVNRNHIQLAIQQDRNAIIEAALANPKADKYHLLHLLGDSRYGWGRKLLALKHPLADGEVLDAAVAACSEPQDALKREEFQKELLNHPELTGDQSALLAHMAMETDKSHTFTKDVFSNPKLPSSYFDDLVEKHGRLWQDNHHINENGLPEDQDLYRKLHRTIDAISHGVKSPSMSAETFNKLSDQVLENRKKREYYPEFFHHSMVKDPRLSAESIKKHLAYGEADTMMQDDDKVKKILAAHPNIDSEGLHAAIKSDPETRVIALQNPKCDESHIRAAVATVDEDARKHGLQYDGMPAGGNMTLNAAFNHPAAPVDLIEKALDSSVAGVRYKAMESPKLPAEKIDKVISDIHAGFEDSGSWMRIANNPSLNDAQIRAALTPHKGIQKPPFASQYFGFRHWHGEPVGTLAEETGTHHAGAKITGGEKSDIEQMREEGLAPKARPASQAGRYDDDLAQQILKRTAFAKAKAFPSPPAVPIDSSHIDLALQHPSPEVRFQALMHPATTPEHITYALQHPELFRELDHAKFNAQSAHGASGASMNMGSVLEPWVQDGHPKHNPLITPEHLALALKHPEEHTVHAALSHPLLPKEEADRILDMVHGGAPLASMPGGSSKHYILESLARNPSLTPEQQLMITGGGEGRPETLAETLMKNPNVHSDTIRDIYNRTQGDDPSLSDRLEGKAFNHAKFPQDLLEKELDRRLPKGGYGVSSLLEHPGVTPDMIARIHDHANSEVKRIEAYPEEQIEADRSATQRLYDWKKVASQAGERLEEHHPDKFFNHSVDVRPGNQKLRKIRDLIIERAGENGDVSPKQLPPGDWSAGRLPNGNISAKKLQEHIDSQPATKYNVSMTTWDKGQQHSDRPSRVLQVNLTSDHVNKMKRAGVYDTFKKMVEASKYSQHPVRASTLGWVRYTGDKKNGFFLDESQSDFGQSFVRQAIGQAEKEDMSEDDINHEAEKAEKEYPTEHYNQIKAILFGKMHPNEALQEAFIQHLRQRGMHNTPLQIHTPESKAPISLGKPLQKQPEPTKRMIERHERHKNCKFDEHGKGCSPICTGGKPVGKPKTNLPAHFHVSYEDLPKKQGMEPSTYGTLKTQTNEDMKGQPTWAGKVRKRED